MSRSKAPLACVWHEERFCTAGPVLWNSVSGLVDGKPCVSMPLNRDRFTMLTHVTCLAFGLSTKIPLMLITSWLLTLYAQIMLSIMANHTCMALQQLSARPSWSIVSLF